MDGSCDNFSNIIQLDGCVSISDSDVNETTSQCDISPVFVDGSCDNLSLPDISETTSSNNTSVNNHSDKTTNIDHSDETSNFISHSDETSACSSINEPTILVNLDKFEIALNLPTIASYNLRSIFPKIKNFKLDILERKKY